MLMSSSTAIQTPQLNCPSVATSSNESVIYTPTASNFMNPNNVIVTYQYTNQTNINPVIGGDFNLFNAPHELALPSGHNVVTVSAASSDTDTAECTFTYFRTSMYTLPSGSYEQ